MPSDFLMNASPWTKIPTPAPATEHSVTLLAVPFWSLPRPLPLIPGIAAHSRGTCGQRARTCIWGSPNSEPCCYVHQVQCWSICLKTSLFPIAPSGTARLVSCWSHLAAFWDPFEVLVHGDGAGTCLGPVRYMYSIKNTVVDMWDCR